MKQVIVASVFLSVLLPLPVASVGQLEAVPILDQFFVPTEAPFFGGVVESRFSQFGVDQAQTFTVGVTGTLASIEIFLRQNTSNGVIVDVRPTVAGAPIEDDASALASQFVPSSSLPSTFVPMFVSVDFSPFGLSLAAGDELALVVRGAVRGIDGGGVDTVGTKTGTGDQYLFGSAYSRSSPTWFQTCAFGNCEIPGNRIDWGFKTFVEQIPEPATVTLMLVGLLGLIGYTRLWKERSKG